MQQFLFIQEFLVISLVHPTRDWKSSDVENFTTASSTHCKRLAINHMNASTMQNMKNLNHQ